MTAATTAPQRQLCAERNRFVAFAFAGGSLLLALDATGRLQSALAGVSWASPALTPAGPYRMFGFGQPRGESTAGRGRKGGVILGYSCQSAARPCPRSQPT